MSTSPSQPDPPANDAAAEIARYLDEMGPLSLGAHFPPSLPAPEPKFPQEKQDEPVRAFKIAYLVVTGSRVAFGPLHAGGTYGQQETSECQCQTDPFRLYGHFASGYIYQPELAHHPQPGKDTQCGFYAWKPDDCREVTAPEWLLECDLYGRVIEHERGYRAQKQRVLRISPAIGPLCEPPFRLVASSDGGRIHALCPSCPEVHGHGLTPDKLRSFLNVEIDLDWARALRETP